MAEASQVQALPEYLKGCGSLRLKETDALFSFMCL